jgi:hypothetical protein
MSEKPSPFWRVRDLGLESPGNTSSRTRTSRLALGMILSAVVLIFLLQNSAADRRRAARGAPRRRADAPATPCRTKRQGSGALSHLWSL